MLLCSTPHHAAIEHPPPCCYGAPPTMLLCSTPPHHAAMEHPPPCCYVAPPTPPCCYVAPRPTPPCCYVAPPTMLLCSTPPHTMLLCSTPPPPTPCWYGAPPHHAAMEHPPHHTAMVRDWLQEAFNSRVTSRTFEDFWLRYSPDLSPCDFFLWGYLKSVDYKDTVSATLEELKKNIWREFRRIKSEALTLRKVYDDVLVRL